MAVKDPYGNKLQEKYNKLYGSKNPFTAGSASTGMWRGINLWAEAVKAAKSVKREDVAKALDKAKLADGPGGPSEVVPGSYHVAMNMYIAVARGGKYEIVEKSGALVAPGECI
jgi:branched-chain amino acid transport system substrate-binding protein